MDKTCMTMETPAGVHDVARQVLPELVRRIAAGDMAGVQIPVATPLFCDNGEGSHYHAAPELFLQVGGCSIMRLTTGTIRIEPGGVLLVPRGVAHQESADSRRSPFCNLVFMHRAGHLHYHAGLPVSRKKAPAAGIYVGGCCDIPHSHGSQLYGYLNEAADFVMAGHPVQHPVVQGLVLTHLALLQELVRQNERSERDMESVLVARCRRMVQEQLADPRLSVQQLAGALRCTPDYLSNRFRRESGIRLIEHINQERCGLARHLLETSLWSIKEVAVRCGYSDSSYFSRVFSQLEGTNPREYRAAEVRRDAGGGRFERA